MSELLKKNPEDKKNTTRAEIKIESPEDWADSLLELLENDDNVTVDLKLGQAGLEDLKTARDWMNKVIKSQGDDAQLELKLLKKMEEAVIERETQFEREAQEKSQEAYWKIMPNADDGNSLNKYFEASEPREIPDAQGVIDSYKGKSDEVFNLAKELDTSVSMVGSLKDEEKVELKVKVVSAQERIKNFDFDGFESDNINRKNGLERVIDEVEYFEGLNNSGLQHNESLLAQAKGEEPGFSLEDLREEWSKLSENDREKMTDFLEGSVGKARKNGEKATEILTSRKEELLSRKEELDRLATGLYRNMVGLRESVDRAKSALGI